MPDTLAGGLYLELLAEIGAGGHSLLQAAPAEASERAARAALSWSLTGHCLAILPSGNGSHVPGCCPSGLVSQPGVRGPCRAPERDRKEQQWAFAWAVAAQTPPPPGLKGKVSPQGQQLTFQVTFVPRAPQDPWTPGIGTQGLQAPRQGDASCRALGLPGGHPGGGLPWEATRPWAPWRGGERAASDHWVGSERKGVQGKKRRSQPEQPEGRSCRHRGQACRESQGSVRQAGAGILTWGESGLSLLPPPLRQESERELSPGRARQVPQALSEQLSDHRRMVRQGPREKLEELDRGRPGQRSLEPQNRRQETLKFMQTTDGQ
ncbi:uncharacterized protein LOC125616854 isoform X1 [Marmota marmota marmota]|uniref:uncharacterized protein LOC125616854 isoform X1 n=1 Tax=Marmota marmota marmota TaxID=9994 RepID=UPI002093E5F9|nr:uncharacterized protein LOC125616854 isoform X1 [Marmota marmota marmota]